jgi:uncharacterized protein (TIGR00290 family)
LAWSSGKDSAWALATLRAYDDLEVVGLLTTLNAAADRVAMHAVRRELAERQAVALGLPLTTVPLPDPCSNAEYERLMAGAIVEAKARGVTHMAFGDLFLEDVRAYRIRQLQETGIHPMFPIWASSQVTPALAHQMIASGIRAIVTCVDSEQLDPAFLGSEFDMKLLRDLPAHVDPCGERGEFHTFCYGGPGFRAPIAVARGRRVIKDQFHFLDLMPAPEDHRRAPPSLMNVPR